MGTVVSGVITLIVEDSKLDCPRFGAGTSFEDCVICEYMRERNTQASDPKGEKISGTVVCEFKKYHK